MKKAILATKVGMTQIFNEDGVLTPGIHLQAQYYSLWEAYLLKHGVSDSVFTNLQNK